MCRLLALGVVLLSVSREVRMRFWMGPMVSRIPVPTREDQPSRCHPESSGELASYLIDGCWFQIDGHSLFVSN